ncbi:MAG: hypothetical protein QOH68_4002 [Nocardioidaceae bacterium]|jgi:hypothetical protein|nr:hypothetical protein [Nocardioidaceae bacterium]
MPVIQVVDGPPREVYDTVGKIVDIESNRPPGLILHAANELPAGNVQIVEVFESEEALQNFINQRLLPAIAEAGFSELADSAPAVATYELFDLLH